MVASADSQNTKQKTAAPVADEDAPSSARLSGSAAAARDSNANGVKEGGGFKGNRISDEYFGERNNDDGHFDKKPPATRHQPNRSESTASTFLLDDHNGSSSSLSFWSMGQQQQQRSPTSSQLLASSMSRAATSTLASGVVALDDEGFDASNASLTLTDLIMEAPPTPVAAAMVRNDRSPRNRADSSSSSCSSTERQQQQHTNNRRISTVGPLPNDLLTRLDAASSVSSVGSSSFFHNASTSLLSTSSSSLSSSSQYFHHPRRRPHRHPHAMGGHCHPPRRRRRRQPAGRAVGAAAAGDGDEQRSADGLIAVGGDAGHWSSSLLRSSGTSSSNGGTGSSPAAGVAEDERSRDRDRDDVVMGNRDDVVVIGDRDDESDGDDESILLARLVLGSDDGDDALVGNRAPGRTPRRDASSAAAGRINGTRAVATRGGGEDGVFDAASAAAAAAASSPSQRPRPQRHSSEPMLLRDLLILDDDDDDHGDDQDDDDRRSSHGSIERWGHQHQRQERHAQSVRSRDEQGRVGGEQQQQSQGSPSSSSVSLAILDYLRNRPGRPGSQRRASVSYTEGMNLSTSSFMMASPDDEASPSAAVAAAAAAVEAAGGEQETEDRSGRQRQSRTGGVNVAAAHAGQRQRPRGRQRHRSSYTEGMDYDALLASIQSSYYADTEEEEAAAAGDDDDHDTTDGDDRAVRTNLLSRDEELGRAFTSEARRLAGRDFDSMLRRSSPTPSQRFMHSQSLRLSPGPPLRRWGEDSSGPEGTSSTAESIMAFDDTLIGDSDERFGETQSSSSSSTPFRGETELYHAVSSGQPEHIVASILESDPSDTSIANGCGWVPLHCAIERYDTPLSVLRRLVEADPTTAAMRSKRDDLSRNSGGSTPVELLWKRFVCPEPYRSPNAKIAAAQFRQYMEEAVGDLGDGSVDCRSAAVLYVERRGSGDNGSVDDEWANALRRDEVERKARAKRLVSTRDDFRAFWDLMVTFVAAAHDGNLSDSATTDGASAGAWSRLVLAAIRIECDPLLVRFASALFPEQLRRREETMRQRLPLHVAAASSPLGTRPRSDGRTAASERTVKDLVRLHPPAASCLDGDGRLPIALALESSTSWEGGVRDLFRACPESLSTRDVRTHLLPFMVAAVDSNRCSLDCVYGLLRESPLDAARRALRHQL